ncbi:IS981 transposase A [Lactococcus cremoris subsp. cremoris NZ9000]|nr:IS981 transposase A [Lactococcus cremoris subsp. cremoris NZ9000]
MRRKPKPQKVNKVMGPKPTIWVAHFLLFNEPKTNIFRWPLTLYSKSNESSVSKADFLELKRQLAKVKEERDILKKVLTIFAEKKK